MASSAKSVVRKLRTVISLLRFVQKQRTRGMALRIALINPKSLSGIQGYADHA